MTVKLTELWIILALTTKTVDLWKNFIPLTAQFSITVFFKYCTDKMFSVMFFHTLHNLISFKMCVSIPQTGKFHHLTTTWSNMSTVMQTILIWAQFRQNLSLVIAQYKKHHIILNNSIQVYYYNFTMQHLNDFLNTKYNY